MKKLLLASLLATACGFAAAQSSVTLYGTLDAGVAQARIGTSTVTGVTSSAVAPSAFGIKGSEDLGGGTRAVFNLESGLNLGTGGTGNSNQLDGALFNRAANVGLAGSFGEVDFGVKLNPFIVAYAGVLPVPSESVYASSAISGGFANFFTNNAVTYTLPQIAGVDVQAQYGSGNQGTGASDNSLYALAAKTKIADIKLTGAWQSVNYLAGSATANVSPSLAGLSTLGNGGPTLAGTQTSYLVGAGYDIGKATLGLGYVRNTLTGFSDGGTADVTQYLVGVGYQLDPVTQLGASYVRNNLGGYLANIQARYALSKRTSVYALVGYAKNDVTQATGDNSAVGSFSPLYGTLEGVTSLQTANGANTAVAAGVIHRF